MVKLHFVPGEAWAVYSDKHMLFDFANGLTIEDAKEIVRRWNAYDLMVEALQEYQEAGDCLLCVSGIDHDDHIGCYCAQDGQCEFCVDRAISAAESYAESKEG